MLITRPQAAIEFPHPTAPEAGQLVAVAPGVLWVRLELPFLLNHVNVYLIEDDGGWALLDTGLGIPMTQAVWDGIFTGPLQGQRLTRVICSHYHPDHVGQVGWLTQRFDCPLLMPRSEFLVAVALTSTGFGANRPFYAERGLPLDVSSQVATGGHFYLKMVTGVPTQFERLQHGQTLRIGGRDFSVITGGGHSPEQAMLHCPAEKIFFSVDQVLTKISPNVSVQSMEPEANPLGEYLASLRFLKETVLADVLVLPGHHLPFTGLPVRAGELIAHHEERCGLIEAACRVAPRTATELLPVVFHRKMDAHQTGFAFGEVVAHVNYMRSIGDLKQFRDSDGILKVEAA
jgi:glyoxylase-like metal-dependent hydrolase (beta-lactamase superfamily II)